jgi:hypothetical protein
MRTGPGTPAAALQHFALFSDLPVPGLIGPQSKRIPSAPHVCRKRVFVRCSQDVILAHLHAIEAGVTNARVATVKSRTFTCIGNNLTPWTGDARFGWPRDRKNASSTSSNAQLHQV